MTYCCLLADESMDCCRPGCSRPATWSIQAEGDKVTRLLCASHAQEFLDGLPEEEREKELKSAMVRLPRKGGRPASSSRNRAGEYGNLAPLEPYRGTGIALANEGNHKPAG